MMTREVPPHAGSCDASILHRSLTRWRPGQQRTAIFCWLTQIGAVKRLYLVPAAEGLRDAADAWEGSAERLAGHACVLEELWELHTRPQAASPSRVRY